MKNHLKRTAHRYITALVIVGLIYLLAGCGMLGLATADDLRAAADRMDTLEDAGKKALDIAQAVPGWPGLIASTLATTLAGGATLNKYRNLTRATDPTVANTAKAPHA